MDKITILCLITLLLCSTLTTTCVARPEPAFTQSSLPISQHVGQKGLEAEDVNNEIENCEGGVSAEECLMRRTLVAHTDYIYTQHQNP